MNLSLRHLAACAALAAAPSAASAQEPPSIQYGRLTITGYELRETRFARPFRVLEQGKPEQLHDYGWLVVIHGQDFPVRALDPILWIGDTPIRDYEREFHGDTPALAFIVVDPTLLRAERELTVIYGTDERTRTKLLERMDPEKLVRLPAAERAALKMPELEGVTLAAPAADGRIAGQGRLDGGRLVLAARLDDGKLVPLARDVKLDAQGRFAVEAGALPAKATHVVALRLAEAGEPAAPLELAALPKGVELLDSKPIRRGGR